MTYFSISKLNKILLSLFISAYSSFGHSTALGDAAPGFTLKSLNGEQTHSLSSYQGKVVYLDFWASWCPPCLVSIPLYSKWAETLDPKESVIITINLDRNPKKAKAFLKRHPVNFLVLSDPKGNIATKYDLPSMPTSYIIDRNGNIMYRHSGFKQGDLELIKEEFNKALKE